MECQLCADLGESEGCPECGIITDAPIQMGRHVYDFIQITEVNSKLHLACRTLATSGAIRALFRDVKGIRSKKILPEKVGIWIVTDDIPVVINAGVVI